MLAASESTAMKDGVDTRKPWAQSNWEKIMVPQIQGSGYQLLRTYTTKSQVQEYLIQIGKNQRESRLGRARNQEK